MKVDFGEFGEGLIEDGKMEDNILVARSLCVLNDKCEVTVQVMNVGPMPVTLYKGTRIAFLDSMFFFLRMLNSAQVSEPERQVKVCSGLICREAN